MYRGKMCTRQYLQDETWISVAANQWHIAALLKQNVLVVNNLAYNIKLFETFTP